MKDEIYLETPETVCPECLERIGQEELDMFGGLCKTCKETDV